MEGKYPELVSEFIKQADEYLCLSDTQEQMLEIYEDIESTRPWDMGMVRDFCLAVEGSHNTTFSEMKRLTGKVYPPKWFSDTYYGGSNKKKRLALMVREYIQFADEGVSLAIERGSTISGISPQACEIILGRFNLLPK